MEPKDIKAVRELINSYLKQFHLAPVMDEEEFANEVTGLCEPSASQQAGSRGQGENRAQPQAAGIKWAQLKAPPFM